MHDEPGCTIEQLVRGPKTIFHLYHLIPSILVPEVITADATF